MRPPVQNPYVILGLPEGATIQQIRKAYRQLAMKSHPDRNPGNSEAGELFIAVQWAYESLTVAPETRRKASPQVQTQSDNQDRDSDPFFNFFEAMRSCYTKQKRDYDPTKR